MTIDILATLQEALDACGAVLRADHTENDGDYYRALEKVRKCAEILPIAIEQIEKVEPVAFMVEGYGDDAKLYAKTLKPTLKEALDIASEFARHYSTVRTKALFDTAAQLARAQAERDVYKKDAERYRWLREEYDERKHTLMIYDPFDESIFLMIGEELDNAIDAAMQKEKEL